MIYLIKKYWKYLFIVCSFTFILLGLYVYYQSNNVVDTTSLKKLDEVTDKKEEKKAVKTVFVDVKGAVNAPGVYELDDGKRVIDAINLAGGLSENANVINLNLSKKLTDEMYVIVYTKDEINNYLKNNKNDKIECASKECVCPNINNDACIKKDNTKNSSEKVGMVSLNSASKEELMSLSGIGDAKAAAIIKYRSENGGFKTIEEVKNVSGIGDAVYEKIKNNITV